MLNTDLVQVVTDKSFKWAAWLLVDVQFKWHHVLLKNQKNSRTAQITVGKFWPPCPTWYMYLNYEGNHIHAVNIRIKFGYLITTVSRVHFTREVQIRSTPLHVLPSLHLTVNHTCIFPLSIYMVNLSYVCWFLQNKLHMATKQLCKPFQAGLEKWHKFQPTCLKFFLLELSVKHLTSADLKSHIHYCIIEQWQLWDTIIQQTYVNMYWYQITRSAMIISRLCWILRFYVGFPKLLEENVFLRRP